MAEYRIQATGETMLEGELRQWAKQTTGASWDATTEEVLETLKVDPVFEGPQAQPTRYQTAFRDGVVQIEGKWYTKYSVANMNAEAVAAKNAEQADNVRYQRNQKLKDSDWSQVSDAPVDKAAWAAYRQALRDVPSQSGFPWEVNWPDQP